MPQRPLDRRLEIHEVDRLRQEVEGTPVHRRADVRHVAIGRDDDGRGALGKVLQLGEQRQPVHARHVDVGHDQIDVAVVREAVQGLLSVMGEQERDEALADLAAELLGDQRLEIRLVIDDEDLGARHAGGHSAPESAERRRSISAFRTGKSIGLVIRPTAPAAMTFSRVSASP